MQIFPLGYLFKLLVGTIVIFYKQFTKKLKYWLRNNSCFLDITFIHPTQHFKNPVQIPITWQLSLFKPHFARDTRKLKLNLTRARKPVTYTRPKIIKFNLQINRAHDAFPANYTCRPFCRCQRDHRLLSLMIVKNLFGISIMIEIDLKSILFLMRDKVVYIFIFIV